MAFRRVAIPREKEIFGSEERPVAVELRNEPEPLTDLEVVELAEVFVLLGLEGVVDSFKTEPDKLELEDGESSTGDDEFDFDTDEKRRSYSEKLETEKQ